MIQHAAPAAHTMSQQDQILERGYLRRVFFSGEDCFGVFTCDGRTDRLRRLLVDGTWDLVDVQ